MYENDYKEIEFLAGVEKLGDEYRASEAWHVRRETYFQFLKHKGLNASTRILDIGCGAMPLAHSVLPLVQAGEGDYFACDISEKTVSVGLRLLSDAGLTLDADKICLTDHFAFPDSWGKIDMAFSNSVFSHLNLNSIYLCLYNLNKILVDGGVYYSSFIMTDTDHDPAYDYPIGQFQSSLWADPFSYRPEVIDAIASVTGFDLEIEEGYTAQHFAILTKRKSLPEDRATARLNHKTPPQPWN